MFVEDACTDINKARNELDESANVTHKGLLLELLLSNIRVIAIKRSIKMSSGVRSVESALYKTLSEIDARLSEEPNQDGIQAYESARNRLNEIQISKGKSATLKSQAAWLDLAA